MGNHMFYLRSSVIFICLQLVLSLHVKKFPLLMPKVHPDREELYLCTPVRVALDKTFYIVGFEPNATMQTAHHMLLYGCAKPGTDDIYWDCGEMAMSSPNNSTLQKASPCKEGSHVIYAWARDAKRLQLPEDVGFEVGPGTQIQYLVLQVHYAHIDKFKDGSTDDSGVFLLYTEERQNKLAGVILLGTGGAIPPNSITHMETDCKINEDKIIYPFAYRTHTHSLGRVVSGYKVRRDRYGLDHWTLLGKRNPLTPQTFYPVFNRDPVLPGDVLAARCTMENKKNTYTHVGLTNNDEMCNFYLMYYVKEGTPLEKQYCFTSGPPYFYWNMEDQLNNIPDVDASML
ncbi:peptidylglycine alpha-hydroxylating monooxygenase [Agrilus planipennis]|uniref:peptidylglycine monooxygenase n=1 Tax=Agrilus planipennis TaxID=224129 RepID=A0A1W4X0R0_AGRPL|nr:peptidylglycine alpha-hydroxylating monooxygenase [Agrilus planipennis]